MSGSLLLMVVVSATMSVVHACHPECRWACDDPVCVAQCEPVCEEPRCEINCGGTDVRCQVPACSVRCPAVDMCESDTCPQCETVCQPPICLPLEAGAECAPLCEAPRCTWQCHKPTCEPPRCELACERPACEAPPPSSTSTASRLATTAAAGVVVFSV